MGAFDPGMVHSDIRLLQKPASGAGFRQIRKLYLAEPDLRAICLPLLEIRLQPAKVRLMLLQFFAALSSFFPPNTVHVVYVF